MLLLGILAALVFASMLVVFRGPPYVPSHARDVRRAFDELYHVGPGDTLVDIGSGDGIVLREAAKRGAQAVGYELNPLLVGISWLLARRYAGVRTELGDFWRATVPPKTTVVYAFGSSRDIEKMAAWTERQATRLGKPLYFISYGFKLERASFREHGAHALYQIEPLQPDEP